MSYKESCLTNIKNLTSKSLWLQFIDRELYSTHNHNYPIDWGIYNIFVDIYACPDHQSFYDRVVPMPAVHVFRDLHLLTYDSRTDILRPTSLGMKFINHTLAPKPDLKQDKYISCVNPLDPKSFGLSRSAQNVRKCCHLTCSIMKYLHPKLTHVDIMTMYKLLQKFYALQASMLDMNDEIDYPKLDDFCQYIEQASFNPTLPVGVESRMDLLKNTVHNVTMVYGLVLDNPTGAVTYYPQDPRAIFIYKKYFKHCYERYTLNSIENITKLNIIILIIKMLNHKPNLLNNGTLRYLKMNFDTSLFQSDFGFF